MAAPAGSVAETRPTRRDVLRAAGAVAGAWALAPAAAPRAEPAVARYRRRNVTDPAAARMLESYKRAIRTMLALPPEDPRNWYRIALVHTVDCPHGNWWFLPWHRGYVGSVERICREVSGDPDFAFPYWDWTELPRVPNPLFDDVLTPTNPAFIATARDFRARFEAAVAAAPWWRRSEPFDAKTPYGQLLARGIRMPEDLWFDINDDPRGRLFFDRANARGPTREQPELDGRTRKAVSRALLLDALAPRDFATFASPKAASHDVLAGFGVLEGQPHKRIHNCLGGVMTDAAGKVTDRGGFMQQNLSPVDPIFFLHHANVDRLWDVWTRKQQARGDAILPEGYPRTPDAAVPEEGDYAAWAAEPFLFFVDAKGEPVAQRTAGDYADIGDFAYDYQPGAGEEVVPAAAARTAPPASIPSERYVGRVVEPFASAQAPARASVTLPGRALRAGTAADAPRLFALVTVALPPLAHGQEVSLYLGMSGMAARPDEALTLAVADHHAIEAPVTFTVPLPRALDAARAPARRSGDVILDLRIVPQAPAAAHGGHLPAPGGVARRLQLVSVVVEAH